MIQVQNCLILALFSFNSLHSFRIDAFVPQVQNSLNMLELVKVRTDLRSHRFDPCSPNKSTEF